MASSRPCPKSDVLTSPSTAVDLLSRQLEGVAAWHARARVARAALAASPGLSREEQLSRHRRGDVLGRQHETIVACTQRALAIADGPLSVFPALRAVIGHRHEWFRTALAQCLEASGVQIVSQSDNGAEIIGMTVAEQPDLLVLDSNPLMVPTEEVCMEVRLLAPQTFIAVQLQHQDAYAGAGPEPLRAHATFSRRARADAVVAAVLPALSAAEDAAGISSAQAVSI